MGFTPNLVEEQRLWAQGYAYVGGVDEAGRGAWAGPVVAAAVILPAFEPGMIRSLAPVRDSKVLSPRQREACYELVIRYASGCGVGFASSSDIDCYGIVSATRSAMRQAIDCLPLPPDYLLIDALPLPDVAIPQRAICKGDRDCLSIAAASIVAKVTRDRWMVALDRRIPGYGLAQHKGYGTAQHRAALFALGATGDHRHSFAPIRALDLSDA